MEAKTFIDLYEEFRDYKTETSLLDEDYQGYKNYLDYLKHTNPEKYKEKVAASVARTKAKKAAAAETMDPAIRAEQLERNLKVAFSRILKKHGVIDPTYYYDEKNQLSKTSVEELADQKPEALQEIVDTIEQSGVDPDRGMELLYQLFGTRDDRVRANSIYTKQRHEHREPDDKLTRNIKRSRKEAQEKDREETIESLKAETDINEFSRKLYDLILTHDLKKTRPLLVSLRDELPEGDPKRRFVDIALNQNLKIKHQKKNLEDFDKPEESEAE